MSHLSSADIKAQAARLGFDLCGVAPAGDLPELHAFDEWLARGYAGEMTYLQRSAGERADVRHVLPTARSVIVTGTIYNTSAPYSTASADPDRAHIARYAWGADYHDVLRARLRALLLWMQEHSDERFEACSFVDDGPVQERVYARHAGLGWIGKNTCVINPQLGSWLFLAEIICSLALAPDEPSLDQCGSCTLCIEACPTAALAEPGVLDATRCISYLTIERRGAIPPDLAPAIGTHVYGCDVCQEVCPWNQRAPESVDPAWQPRRAWTDARISTLSNMTDEELRVAMRGSAMKRATVSGFRRNLAVARDNADRD